jgi:hypothetical protein
MAAPAFVSSGAWRKVLRDLRRDRLSRRNPAYAYGTVLACLQAAHSGCPAVVVAEFGVAWGHGLLELAHVADRVSRASGIEISVVGFDREGGLPAPRDSRDHPEVWSAGQFASQEHQDLRKRLSGRARLIVGDLSDTVAAFAGEVTPDRPLGAVMLDVDIYASAKDALRVFDGPADRYLPAVLMYVDDIDGLLTFNGRGGEALAIAEHNAASRHRYIERKRIRADSPPRRWHDKMFVCHVLDHPLRNGICPPSPFEINVDQY